MPPRGSSTDDNDIPAGTIVKPLMPTDVSLPDILVDKIDFTAWATSLATGVTFTEKDPDYLSRELIMQTLLSDTLEEVFEQAGIRGLQDSVPNVPDASTGPITITDMYVAKSDKEMGTPCYVILTVFHIETGEIAKYTTGAQQIQAQILGNLKFGNWPIACEIKRTDRKDRGGRYLFWMFPVE